MNLKLKSRLLILGSINVILTSCSTNTTNQVIYETFFGYKNPTIYRTYYQNLEINNDNEKLYFIYRTDSIIDYSNDTSIYKYGDVVYSFSNDSILKIEPDTEFIFLSKKEFLLNGEKRTGLLFKPKESSVGGVIEILFDSEIGLVESKGGGILRRFKQ